MLTNPVNLNQATYIVNNELPSFKIPSLLLEQPPFSLNIPGLLLVDLFPAPVTSSLGPWTNPSEEYMYVCTQAYK